MVHNMVLNSISTILFTEYRTYSNFTRLSIVSLLQDPMRDCILYVVMAYLFSFFQFVTIPLFFLVFMTSYFWVLPRKCTGHSKHPLPTTQEKTLHMDITRWSTPKSDWLYSLQPKMEKLYRVSKNKTRSWLWLRSWTPCCQIQT